MIYLLHIEREKTGRSGCIAMSKDWPATDMSTISGFAEVDPNALFADDQEGDRLAKHLAASWNACAGIPTEALTPGLMGELVEALAWYGEQSRLARLVTSDGNAGRHAIDADGGKRARVILAKLGKVTP